MIISRSLTRLATPKTQKSSFTSSTLLFKSQHSLRNFSSTIHIKMKVHPVPVRDDNYAYILQSSKNDNAVFVDPFDIPALQKAAKSLGLKDENIVGLLTTHHHQDHSGGNAAFAKAYPNRPVFGGSDNIPSLTKLVKDGDSINDLLKGVEINCLATPCHTQDHICYYVSDSPGGKKGVFTGDTLFISGCGRFFEGTPEEMLSALTKLSKLPQETLVFCGHEYTKSNVAFSAAILPTEEQGISKLIQDLKEGKNNGVTTGVYTIGDENKHNPFMRCDDPVVQKAAEEKFGKQLNSPKDVMHALRELKNGGKVKANI